MLCRSELSGSNLINFVLAKSIRLKEKVLLTVLFLSCFQFGHPQSAFKVLFQNPLDDYVGDMVEGANNTYYAVGCCGYNFEPWNFRGLVYRLRSEADTFSIRIAFSDTVTRFLRILNRGVNKFIILGAICNPPEYHERLLIAGMDTNLNITWRKEYRMKNYDRIWRINYLYKNSYSLILFGNIVYDSLGGQVDGFFAEVTLDGDTVKTGYYLSYNPNIHSGVYNPDSSGLWIFGEGFDYNGRGERAEFDTNFILNRIDWIPEVVDGYSHAQWYSGNKLLFGGLFQIDPYGGGPQDNDMGVSFMDTALNIPDLHYFGAVDTIDYPAINRIFHYLDTNRIYIAGTYHVIIDFYPQGISWIMTGLLDHDLNTIYFYLYGGDAYYVTTNILATSDGGSIISAMRYDYITQWNERDIYFLKLDENGLITSGGTDQKQPLENVLLFPNPGKDLISIMGVNQGTVEIYSVYGQEMISHSIEISGHYISVTNIQPGCYYFRLLNDKGAVYQGKWIKI
jgi:hypothetical protein